MDRGVKRQGSSVWLTLRSPTRGAWVQILPTDNGQIAKSAKINMYARITKLFVSNKSEEGSMDSNNWLQQLMMLGIGTTSLVADKLKEVSEELVKDGKLNPEQAKAVMDDLLHQLQSEQGNWDEQMQRQMRNMMQDLGVARQSEVDELRGRIDRLERQVRDLENKLWR
jgi:polyhydroxyalkanoate synthesis regulator phasin